MKNRKAEWGGVGPGVVGGRGPAGEQCESAGCGSARPAWLAAQLERLGPDPSYEPPLSKADPAPHQPPSGSAVVGLAVPRGALPQMANLGSQWGRKLQHAKHVDRAHGGLGGAHTHPGPSPRPHSPRHPRPRDPHPLGRVVPVPVTQATRSPSPWPRGPCPHHPGRTVPVPITQTIQLTSGSHRGRRPVDRSQDLQQMRQRGILLRNQHDQTGGRKWVSTGIAPVRGRPPSFR